MRPKIRVPSATRGALAARAPGASFDHRRCKEKSPEQPIPAVHGQCRKRVGTLHASVPRPSTPGQSTGFRTRRSAPCALPAISPDGGGRGMLHAATMTRPATPRSISGAGATRGDGPLHKPRRKPGKTPRKSEDSAYASPFALQQIKLFLSQISVQPRRRRARNAAAATITRPAMPKSISGAGATFTGKSTAKAAPEIIKNAREVRR